MRHITTHLIEQSITFVITLLQLVITRWLLAISSPEQDMQWIEQHDLLYHWHRLKWYRGLEYLHQIRFRRIVASW
jgi:hypothetical protein